MMEKEKVRLCTITHKLSEIKYHIENHFHANCSAFIYLFNILGKNLSTS